MTTPLYNLTAELPVPVYVITAIGDKVGITSCNTMTAAGVDGCTE